MDQQTYLETRLEEQLNWYNAKSQWNQKWYKRLKIFEITAAALIPLLTGFTHDKEIIWSILVGALGALIAISAGIASIYKFQELWLEYRKVTETLHHHKYLFLTQASPYHTENAFTLFVETIEDIFAKENTKTLEIIAKETPNRSQQTTEHPQAPANQAN